MRKHTVSWYNAPAAALAVSFACSGDPSGPAGGFSFQLNGGAQETRQREIVVRLIAPGAVEFRLAEAAIDTATFVTYADSTTWVLTSGDGSRSLYAQVRYSSGAVSAVEDAVVVLSEHAYASPSGSDAASGSYFAKH